MTRYPGLSGTVPIWVSRVPRKVTETLKHPGIHQTRFAVVCQEARVKSVFLTVVCLPVPGGVKLSRFRTEYTIYTILLHNEILMNSLFLKEASRSSVLLILACIESKLWCAKIHIDLKGYKHTKLKNPSKRQYVCLKMLYHKQHIMLAKQTDEWKKGENL